MGHVFLSYARKDRMKAEAIAAALEEQGIAVWMDDRLVPGAHFDVAIEQALAAADKVIVVWSPASYASRWVRAEAGEGLERGILVPVLIEDSPIPLEFRRVHAVDLTRWDGDKNNHLLVPLVTALTGAPSSGSGTAAESGDITRKSQPHLKQARALLVSTDAVRATKYWGSNFRFRLRLDDRSIGVRHVDLGIVHWLSVDGKRVSRRHWLVLPDYYEFSVDSDGGQHKAQLTIDSDGLMLVNAISLAVDGEEVLLHRVRWRDGTISAVAVTSLFILPLSWILYGILQ